MEKAIKCLQIVAYIFKFTNTSPPPHRSVLSHYSDATDEMQLTETDTVRVRYCMGESKHPCVYKHPPLDGW